MTRCYSGHVSRKAAARAKKMARLYKDGKTLQEIGDRYGLTRERVRQILQAHGVDGREKGGAYARATTRLISSAREAEGNKEARCFRAYGCDVATFQRLNLGMARTDKASPAAKWAQQRNSARNRGIPWELTFVQWMTIWNASGKWEQRGLGIGKYCMARKGDTGPYADGNVYITTCDDNVRDYQARLRVDGVTAGDGFSRLPESPVLDVLGVVAKRIGVFDGPWVELAREEIMKGTQTSFIAELCGSSRWNVCELKRRMAAEGIRFPDSPRKKIRRLITTP